ncbi:MAG TPA: MaoC/PaaZ C-terminal domain-containing protein [Terriglobales bacterium]|nr:MaoC/PaaZ C-terminal domain-containing protein [Terriglobales bacterium]
MPVDPTKAMAATMAGGTGSWDQDDVILYHLGIGAGFQRPTDKQELEYTYEGNLKVLPSFGVIPVFGAMGGMAGVPGIEINFMMVLHGEQDLEIHRPIPTSAKVKNQPRIAGIYDKGKAALIVIEVDTTLENGEKLFTNRFGIFARGEGGFGGEPGPKTANNEPSRPADAIVETPTMPQQALIYRLSGDKNPLHADPDFAKMGGFDKPILHGLCSYGIVCKAAVDELLGGDVNKVARYQARFTGVFFPGETMVTSMWKEGDQIILSAKAKERQSAVISNAALTLR